MTSSPTHLQAGDQSFPLLSPLPEGGLRILLDELLPAEQMGVQHPHTTFLCNALIIAVCGPHGVAAACAAIALGLDGYCDVLNQIEDAYSAQLDKEIAL